MLIDSHCHVSTNLSADEVSQLYEKISQGKDEIKLVLMSTNHIDFKTVDKLGELENVVPCFGIHPWFAHLFKNSDDECVDKRQHYSKVFGRELKINGDGDEGDEGDKLLLERLPEPIDLDEHIGKLRDAIKRHVARGSLVCVGEIGYDKVFRIPSCGYSGNEGVDNNNNNNNNNQLTRYKTTIQHQKLVFQKCLSLAIEHNLSISLHNVKSGGTLYRHLQQMMDNYNIYNYNGNLCLHSYTGSRETLEMFTKTFNVFVSLSRSVNFEQRLDHILGIIETIGSTKVLIESDLYIDCVDIIAEIKQTNNNLMELKPLKPLEPFNFNFNSNFKHFLRLSTSAADSETNE